jgi:hypothetical protein
VDENSDVQLSAKNGQARTIATHKADAHYKAIEAIIKE